MGLFFHYPPIVEQQGVSEDKKLYRWSAVHRGSGDFFIYFCIYLFYHACRRCVSICAHDISAVITLSRL